MFRHVPSGKSYSRAPKHLLPPGYSPPSKKRRVDDDFDSDVYKFDEGDDFQAPTKVMKHDHRYVAHILCLPVRSEQILCLITSGSNLTMAVRKRKENKECY